MDFEEESGTRAFLLRARREGLRDFGACMAPMTAFQILQGIETLHAAHAAARREHAHGRRVPCEASAGREGRSIPSCRRIPITRSRKKLLPHGCGAVFSLRDQGRPRRRAARSSSRCASSRTSPTSATRSRWSSIRRRTTHFRMSDEDLAEGRHHRRHGAPVDRPRGRAGPDRRPRPRAARPPQKLMKLAVDGRRGFRLHGRARARSGEAAPWCSCTARGSTTRWFGLQSRYFGYHGCNVLALDLPGPRPLRRARRSPPIDGDGRLGFRGARCAGHRSGEHRRPFHGRARRARVRGAPSGSASSASRCIGVAYPMKVSEAFLEAARSATTTPPSTWRRSGATRRRCRSAAIRIPGMWMYGDTLARLERLAPGVLLQRPQGLQRLRVGLRRRVKCPVALHPGQARRDDAAARGDRPCATEAPNGRTVVIEVSGHSLMAEAPDDDARRADRRSSAEMRTDRPAPRRTRSSAQVEEPRRASAGQPPYAQFSRNFSSTSARDSGSCAPPRMCGCRSSSTLPSFSLHAHVAGEFVGVGIVRVDLVAHLGGERAQPRIAHALLGEGVEPGVAEHEAGGDAVGLAELGGVGVRRRAASPRAAPTGDAPCPRRPRRRFLRCHPVQFAWQAGARNRCRDASWCRRHRA